MDLLETGLAAIFKQRACIDFIASTHLRDEKLLGENIGMPARELILTLYDIEREMNTKIPEEAVLIGYFDSFNHILEIIKHSTIQPSKGGSYENTGKKATL